jgi:hypothetical protein
MTQRKTAYEKELGLRVRRLKRLLAVVSKLRDEVRDMTDEELEETRRRVGVVIVQADVLLAEFQKDLARGAVHLVSLPDTSSRGPRQSRVPGKSRSRRRHSRT